MNWERVLPGKILQYHEDVVADLEGWRRLLDYCGLRLSKPVWIFTTPNAA